jgi:AcrR family transcriptional regulator
MVRAMDLVTEQRLARRAAILEAARRMIAEVGYEAVTVRDLAERCRVSVPTLYNQFGGKDQLLGAAIEEHFLGVLNDAELSKADGGFDRLLRVIDQIAEQLLALAAYHRRLLKAFASLDQTAALQQHIAEQLTIVLDQELETMQAHRQFEGWVETELIAEQLTSACISTALVWSSGLLPDEHLKPAMRYGTGLVLASLVRGQASRLLKAQLKESQTELLRARGARQHKLKVSLRGVTT